MMKEVLPTEVPTDAQLIDVRNDDEWDDGHAATARHIPMPEIPDRLSEIDQDRDIYVICQSGGRSGQVVQWLEHNGIDAINVAGGTRAWAAANLPMA